MRIILVEDEKKLVEALMRGLTSKGYAVDSLERGDKALDRLLLNHMDYDLIILDLMLPGLSGEQICSALRQANITTPIIILTARDEIDTKVQLLLSGADDYVVKPFSFEELVARIQAVMRRPSESLPNILKIRDIELNPMERTVERDGKMIPLTLKEFVLLEYFMTHPNKAINREELLTHLWDFNYSSFSNVVDVHVKNLRRKLDDHGDGEDILETVRGVGYRLKS
jgi:DNA-binding response OmpR family regulator